jgi:5-methyltetrahydropteroyltriglutamate--homocysteine methyltransferase
MPTTNVGSLRDLERLDEAAPGYEAALRQSADGVVRTQREIGIDVINAGELPLIAQGKDREDFAEFYRYVTDRSTLIYAPGEQIRPRQRH